MTGFRGKITDAAKQAAQKAGEARDRRVAEAPARAQAQATQAAARAEAQHYEAEVNKGSISIKWFNDTLNKRWRAGWKLSHMFEQRGNTIIVWERRPTRLS